MSEELAIPIIQEVRRIALRPDDVVVVQTTWYFTPQQRARAYAQLSEMFPGHHTLILENGATLTVAEAEAAAEAPIVETEDGHD